MPPTEKIIWLFARRWRGGVVPRSWWPRGSSSGAGADWKAGLCAHRILHFWTNRDAGWSSDWSCTWEVEPCVFVSGGSEATEVAIKLVRQYFVEKGETQRLTPW